MKVTQSCPTLFDPMDCTVHGILQTRILSLFLIWGIFPAPGLNPGLLHCRQILYQLNHKGSPRIREWITYPFFSGSSLRRPRNRIGVSHIAGRFFTNWAIREDNKLIKPSNITRLNCQAVLWERKKALELKVKYIQFLLKQAILTSYQIWKEKGNELWCKINLIPCEI